LIRHCERSEAIQRRRSFWIASPELVEGAALLAMTGVSQLDPITP
jgi:hypothetical protein